MRSLPLRPRRRLRRAAERRDLLAPLVFAAPGQLPALESRPGERAKIAGELERANASYGHPRARELARRFADPDTLVVVAGQQAGLFGGPLYTLDQDGRRGAGGRAVSSAPAARRWRSSGWRPRTTTSPRWRTRDCSARTGPRDVALGADPSPLVPVGMRTLGPALASALDACASPIPAPTGGDAWRLLESTYRPRRALRRGVRKLMAPARRARAAPGRRHAAGAQAGAAAVARARGRAPPRDLRPLGARRRGSGRDRARAPGRGRPIAAPLFVLHGRERRRVLWDGADASALRGVERRRAAGRRPARHRRRQPGGGVARRAAAPGGAGRGARHRAPAHGPGRARLPGAGGGALRRARGGRAARGAAAADAGARSQAARSSRRPRAHARRAPARRALGVRAARARRRRRSASRRCARPRSPSSIAMQSDFRRSTATSSGRSRRRASRSSARSSSSPARRAPPPAARPDRARAHRVAARGLPAGRRAAGAGALVGALRAAVRPRASAARCGSARPRSARCRSSTRGGAVSASAGRRRAPASRAA